MSKRQRPRHGLQQHAAARTEGDDAAREDLAALNRSQSIAEFACDGTILSANANFLAMMGYRLHEIAGRHHSIFVEPADRDSQAYADLWRGLNACRSATAEFKRITKDGREVWIQGTYSPVPDRNGGVKKIIKVATEVTRFKTISADHAGQIAAIGKSLAVIEFALDGTVLAANENFLKMLGYGLEEVQGRHHRMFVVPALRDSAAYRDFWADLTLGKFKTAEFNRLGKDGREVWIQASYNPIFDLEGKPFKVVKFAIDVTAQKMRAADDAGQIAAIQRSQATDEFKLDGTIVHANANFLAAFGYDLDEIRGRPHRMLVEDDYAASDDYATFWARLARGEYIRAEFKRLGKNGREVWIQASYNPILDLDGQPVRVIKFATDITEEVRRRENFTLLSLVADGTDNAVIITDAARAIIYVNPGFTRLTGYTFDQVRGRSPGKLLQGPHTDDRTRAKIRADLAAGKTFHEEILNYNCRGEPYWISLAISPVRGASGAIEKFVAIQSNLTATKLQSLEFSTKLAAIGASTGIAEWSLDGALVSANSILGADAKTRTTLGSILGLCDRIRLRARQHVRREIAWPCGERILWLDAMFSILEDVEGEPARILMCAVDITARRAAELAMRASESRYRVLAETTSDVVTQLDLDFRRTYVSPACRVVLGYEPEEMLGGRPAASIHPDDVARVQALAARLVTGEFEGDRAVTIYRAQHKEGHYVWLEAGINLVRDPVSDDPTSIICSLRDVTERQRTARHLERAKAAAEQGAQAKAEFVANMSHELRTPLTGMLGVHDLLRAHPAMDDAQRRLVDLASDSGRALLAIVNDILDFSKVEAGQLTIEAIPFEPHRLVASCRDLAAQGLGGKPVTIEATFMPGLPDRFIGDPTRVRQILLNLLTNAVKFTEQGRIAIAMSYEASGAGLRVEVRDTGIGIPSDKVSSLFERFTQADASVTRRYGGTGLGLAICKRLLDAMGGRIGASRNLEGGSTFWFELPLPVHQGPGPNDRPADPAPARPGCKILLAEDNVINREIIAAMLTGRGHSVTTVADGGEALDAARRDTGFDLILMDLQMPVMDGLSAAAALRRHEASPGRRRTPIIGLTANAMIEDVARCTAAGMDAHVAKPVDWPTLFAAIDRLLAPPDPEAQSGPQILEEATLASLARVIGRDRVAAMLARFVTEVKGRLDTLDGASAADVAAQAHALASTSGQLGFRRLSDLCRAVEDEFRETGRPPRIDALRDAADRAARAAAVCPFAHAA